MSLSSFNAWGIGGIVISLVLYLILGYVLVYFAKDELKEGRKWFKLLIGAGIIGGVVFLILSELVLAISCLGIALIGFISLLKN